MAQISETTWVPRTGQASPADRPKIALHCGESPVQLDFTTLSGDLGVHWSKFLKERLVTRSLLKGCDATILRVSRSAYGTEKLGASGVRTGGLEQEMSRMDRAIAQEFPVTIHVLHHSDESDKTYEKMSAGWRGRVVVHRTNLLRGDNTKIRERIFTVLERINPSLVHIHHPWDPIDWDIIKHVPKSIPVVASYHVTSTGAVNPWAEQPFQRLFTYARKAFEHYSAERDSGQPLIGALNSTAKRVIGFAGRSRLAERCRLEVTQRSADPHPHSAAPQSATTTPLAVNRIRASLCGAA